MDNSERLTVVFPIRIADREQEEKINSAIFSCLTIYNVSIIVLEMDTEPKFHCPKVGEHISVHFEKDDTPVFCPEVYIDRLLDMAETDIVGIWDGNKVCFFCKHEHFAKNPFYDFEIYRKFMGRSKIEKKLCDGRIRLECTGTEYKLYI